MAAKERLKSRYCSTKVIKICERHFLCRSLEFLQNVTNVPVVAPDLSVGARLHQFLGNLGSPWGQSKSHKNPQRRVHSPDPTKLDKINDHHKCLRNSYLTEALHALVQKNAVELVKTQQSLVFSTDFSRYQSTAIGGDVSWTSVP